jgi:hypothetical protein
MTPTTSALLTGAIARTEIQVPGADVLHATATTGGGSLNVSRTLTRNLQASFLVDVARSFYAPESTAMTFVPRWGV